MNNDSFNGINFKSASHVYFYTPDGKRIIFDKNVKKCERYLVRHLNGAKNIKDRNQNLCDTFKKGDIDYKNKSIVRSVYEYAKDKTHAFVNIVTGRHVEPLNRLGQQIGEIKRLSQSRVGSNYSFESLDAIGRYYKKANQIIKENGIYKDGKRQAFGVIFEPQYKKNGELKDFKYVRSAWFDENKVK